SRARHRHHLGGARRAARGRDPRRGARGRRRPHRDEHARAERTRPAALRLRRGAGAAACGGARVLAAPGPTAHADAVQEGAHVLSRAILHATDFSPASRPAFAKAMEMARRDHAPLLIAHVMAPVMPMMAGDGYISPATWDAIAKGYRKTSQKKL